MLESFDGKISTGNNDSLDADKDFCKIDGVKEGLNQYYEIECTTDYFSLNICHWVEKLILVTTNKNHIAYSLKEKYNNLDIMFYKDLDLNKLLEDLSDEYNAERVTISKYNYFTSRYI